MQAKKDQRYLVQRQFTLTPLSLSEPFALGDRKRVALKVIDERGNEPMRVVDVSA